MMKAVMGFNQSVMSMPKPWRLWMMLLVTANLVVPLFFLSRPEAWVILGCLMISMIFMTLLTARVGYASIRGRSCGMVSVDLLSCGQA